MYEDHLSVDRRSASQQCGYDSDNIIASVQQLGTIS